MLPNNPPGTPLPFAPPEIWLEIARRLDCFSLKALQRCSRRFLTLTLHKSLDGLLFRTRPAPHANVLARVNTVQRVLLRPVELPPDDPDDDLGFGQLLKQMTGDLSATIFFKIHPLFQFVDALESSKVRGQNPAGQGVTVLQLLRSLKRVEREPGRMTVFAELRGEGWPRVHSYDERGLNFVYGNEPQSWSLAVRDRASLVTCLPSQSSDASARRRSGLPEHSMDVHLTLSAEGLLPSSSTLTEAALPFYRPRLPSRSLAVAAIHMICTSSSFAPVMV